MKSDLFYFRGTLLLDMSSGDQSSRGPLGGESCYYIPGALYTRCIIYQVYYIPGLLYTRSTIYQVHYIPGLLYTRSTIYQVYYIPGVLYTRCIILTQASLESLSL